MSSLKKKKSHQCPVTLCKFYFTVISDMWTTFLWILSLLCQSLVLGNMMTNFAAQECNIFTSSVDTITSRSTTETPSRLTCWGSTAATSPPRPSYRPGRPSTLSLCLTMPTRGRASRCAMKYTRPVRTKDDLCCFLLPGQIVTFHLNKWPTVFMYKYCTFYNRTYGNL